MNISFSSLNKLTRWESYQFLSDVVAYTDTQSEGMSELFNSKFAEFVTAFNIFDKALVQEGRTTSEQLIKAEEGRDFAVRKIYSLIKEYANFPFEKEKEDAAKVLLKLFKPYGTGYEIAAMAQDSETAILTNLFQDIEESVAVEQCFETLGLTFAIDQLQSHNATFVELQRQRKVEDAEFVSGVVKNARTDAQTEFISFVEIVNALSIVEGEEKYTDLKQKISSMHDDVVKRAKQRTRKKEEETEEIVAE